MKKFAVLFLGTLMIAGGLLVSCQKKECHPHPHPHPHPHCGPCHMDHPNGATPPPPCKPCKRY